MVGKSDKIETLKYKLYLLISISVYKMLINKKDIARINQEIGGNGLFQNESSLDFALSIIKQKKSWLYELSYLLRGLLVDHAFQDGNKRTALIIAITYLEDRDLEYDKESIIKIIWEISKKNVKDINKITRMIKSAIVF